MIRQANGIGFKQVIQDVGAAAWCGKIS
jgi:hypothetical protein